MQVIKRNGSAVTFDETKILNAVTKANKDVSKDKQLSKQQLKDITDNVVGICKSLPHAPTVEEIQDIVEKSIVAEGSYDVTKSYIIYRYNRALVRKANSTDATILQLVECANDEAKTENSNKNPVIVSVQRDYMAGETSRDLTMRFFLPEHIAQAHKEGIIHFHDSDYFAQHMHNCSLVNLEDMLQNGTVIGGTLIETPHSFSTACNIATQIIAQVASCQYGGQSISLAHLAPFIDVTRKRLWKKAKSLITRDDSFVDWDYIERSVEQQLDNEIEKGVQILQYQIITLMTTNGQAPFVTFYMNINEVPEGQTRDDFVRLIMEVLKQRYEGVKNEKGVFISPAFPKLIYVLDENNVYKDSPYFYVTEMAAKCTAKRMVPDYISAKKMRELKKGNVYTCMGCRSFLTPEPTIRNDDGSWKFYGRFNQGVVTLNLVDVACSSKGDMFEFWNILEERLQLCYEALMIRHKRLRGTVSDMAPILWQHGALARLAKGEKIDKLLYGGYSTLSLGYAGLWECVKYLTGRPFTEGHAFDLAVQIMKALNDACAKWREETNIAFSLYGTPLESTTYKFAKCLQRRFGIIEGVTDKNYITNSYHIHVQYDIDAFEKLKIESVLQELSPGGAVSYVEVPNMQNNIAAVISVMQYMYDTIMYGEMNTKSDYCQKCGFDGEIKIVNDHDELVWECPNCGNRDTATLNVARRTCGYIGTQFWNQGRTQEIRERVLHL